MSFPVYASAAPPVLAAQSIPAPEMSRTAAPNLVSILYGTDRTRKPSDQLSFDYSGERAGRLEVGEAEVSVPKAHVPGKLERPGEILFVVKRPEDPKKHFVLARSPIVLSEADFAAREQPSSPTISR